LNNMVDGKKRCGVKVRRGIVVQRTKRGGERKKPGTEDGKHKGDGQRLTETPKANGDSEVTTDIRARPHVDWGSRRTSLEQKKKHCKKTGFEGQGGPGEEQRAGRNFQQQEREKGEKRVKGERERPNK